jgi:hypothetical protein
MLLRSAPEAWLKRTHFQVLGLVMLPSLTFLLSICPQNLFSPALKRVLEQTSHLHVGLVCYSWVYFKSTSFQIKFCLLPWVLLPWLFDSPQDLPLLISAISLSIIQERLSHWLGTTSWFIALIHLDLIWMAYRPFFFPRLVSHPLFFGSILSEPFEFTWTSLSFLSLSFILIFIPFLCKSLFSKIWHQKKHD